MISTLLRALRVCHIPLRTLFLGGLAFTLLTGFFWPRFFTLHWEEELQLHDGRVIIVKLKYTYERRGRLTFSRYDPSLFREATLTFDGGPSSGIVTQRFIHQRPMALDTGAGDWFVVLQGRAGSDVQNWGPPQNGNGQRTARLSGTTFEPTPIANLPLWMNKANLLMDYAPKSELALFDGTRVTLSQKAIYLQKYPLGPIDARIDRPQAIHSRSAHRVEGTVKEEDRPGIRRRHMQELKEELNWLRKRCQHAGWALAASKSSLVLRNH